MHLNSDAMAAFNELKNYFGRDNTIKTVRNKFSFYYNLWHTKASLAGELDDDELFVYLAEDVGNTLIISQSTS